MKKKLQPYERPETGASDFTICAMLCHCNGTNWHVSIH